LTEHDGASWRYVRHLERRVAELEKWRATVETVAAWRRWAAPTILSAVAVGATILNVVHR
jgi:hypothetical protein